MEANVYEVFSSIQGEGIFLGSRHLFLRLTGCNLRCSYCDTAESFEAAESATIYYPAEEETFQVPNPLTMDTLWDILLKMRPERHHSLSITGGEPLMQPEVVAEIAARWRQLGGRVLLETNGTLVDAFEKVADNIDIVSMDIKLQPAVEKTPWQQQQRFLEHAVKRCDSVYVKVVVGKEVSISQLEEAAQLVAAAGKHIPFILQAEAECSQSKDLQGQLEQFQWRLSRWLPDVRIIPQLHKLLGVR